VTEQIFDLILLFVILVLDVLLAAGRSAYVNSRSSILAQMRDEGTRGAQRALITITEASRLILSLRLGQAITRMSAIAVTWLAARPLVMAVMDERLLAVSGVVLVAGIIVTSIEFFVENLTLRQPEKWAARLSPFVSLIVTVLSPFGGAMLRIARALAGTEGEQHHPLVTEEQIMTLVDAGEEEGVIEEEEKAMIFSIFQLGDTLAREVMIPRIDIQGFEENDSIETAIEDLLRTGYSRAPVYSESIDNVVGMVYLKDLLASWWQGKRDLRIRELMREAYFIPEGKKVDDLLTEMQAMRTHMSVVVDEYGGTAGVVTIEDIVEEIVGEILDEYDMAEELPYQQLREGEYIFSGGIDLDDVNQLTGSALPKDTTETLGGFIYSRLGKVPTVGEEVSAGGLKLVVEQVVGRRIRKIRAELLPPTEDRHEQRNGQNGPNA
jgi:CBS domain containing-hemolysin-like protein